MNSDTHSKISREADIQKRSPPISSARARQLSNPKPPPLRATTAPPILPIATLVLWLTCLATGLIGLFIPYPYPQPSIVRDLQTQLVNVALPPDPAPLRPQAPPPEPIPSDPALSTPIPQAPPPAAVAEAPAVTAVAAPSAAVAFAVPVQGLTRIVDANLAAHAAPARTGSAARSGSGPGGPAAPPTPTKPAPIVAAPPSVTRLTFGQGEGRQPPPDYPPQAATTGQQGNVTVRFTVDETGSVTSAQIPPGGATRWPLLNQSALRKIREDWHFPPGPARLYEVLIQFELPK